MCYILSIAIFMNFGSRLYNWPTMIPFMECYSYLQDAYLLDPRHNFTDLSEVVGTDLSAILVIFLQ